VTGRPDVTAIVLAGGRSSRFGSDKLSVEFEGRLLIDRAIDAVGRVVTAIIVAGAPVPRTRSGDRHEPPIRSVPDGEAFAGPLAALAGALGETTTGLAIVVGGDMPSLVPAVLAAMLQRLTTDEALDAVLLEAPGTGNLRRQVLPLALRAAPALAAAVDAVREGDRSLVRLVDRLRCSDIPVADWLALDPEGRTLFDVDRPADMQRIHDEFR